MDYQTLIFNFQSPSNSIEAYLDLYFFYFITASIQSVISLLHVTNRKYQVSKKTQRHLRPHNFETTESNFIKLNTVNL